MSLEAQTDTEVEALREKLRNPQNLPKTQEVLQAFTFTAQPGEKENDFQKFLDQIYHGHVFEYYTEEYINGLAGHLANRIGELGGTSDNKIRILEIAAGHGRLSGFLSRYLEENPDIKDKFTLVATDNFDTYSKDAGQNFPVEELDYEAALHKYNPQIVLAAWLPQGTMKRTGIAKYFTDEDWSEKIRATSSVQEYILIGDTEITARPETFGRNRAFFSRPSYAREGFRMKALKELRQYQFGWTSTYQNLHTSSTLVFNRK